MEDKMRIGFISSYPPVECGIATYTQYLTDELRKKGVDTYIVSHYGSQGKNVFPAFDYDDPDFSDKSFSMMMRFTPDIVHIQHEFGLYSGKFGLNIIPLILNFRLIDIPVITTLHTVYKDMPKEHKIITDAIVRNSIKVIVHENYQKDTLLNVIDKSFEDKIAVIPHGSRVIKEIDNAKKILNLPDNSIVLTQIGYFRPSKNFETTIDIFNELANKYENILLVIAGKIRGIEHREYRDIIFKKIEESPFKNRIYLIRGQLSQSSFDTVISASDIIILPYKINSQSGILAHCLAFGKPVVSSATLSMVQTFEKSKSGFACNTLEEYIEKTAALIEDESLRKSMSINAKIYVKNEISWDIIANKHIELYKKLTKVNINLDNIITLD
ncbi:glycosyl transferase [Deferribacter desulfuricans SSM1]|uniref:Glycosyl transferase n=2 Tax=Deferribacter TaxID=53572 RepID=D3P9G3_DEFDS|nr:glycosyl transferase [Deferribacter desulfuricans SSM1]